MTDQIEERRKKKTSRTGEYSVSNAGPLGVQDTEIAKEANFDPAYAMEQTAIPLSPCCKDHGTRGRLLHANTVFFQDLGSGLDGWQACFPHESVSRVWMRYRYEHNRPPRILSGTRLANDGPGKHSRAIGRVPCRRSAFFPGQAICLRRDV